MRTRATRTYMTHDHQSRNIALWQCEHVYDLMLNLVLIPSWPEQYCCVTYALELFVFAAQFNECLARENITHTYTHALLLTHALSLFLSHSDRDVLVPLPPAL